MHLRGKDSFPLLIYHASDLSYNPWRQISDDIRSLLIQPSRQ